MKFIVDIFFFCHLIVDVTLSFHKNSHVGFLIFDK